MSILSRPDPRLGRRQEACALLDQPRLPTRLCKHVLTGLHDQRTLAREYEVFVRINFCLSNGRMDVQRFHSFARWSCQMYPILADLVAARGRISPDLCAYYHRRNGCGFPPLDQCVICRGLIRHHHQEGETDPAKCGFYCAMPIRSNPLRYTYWCGACWNQDSGQLPGVKRRRTDWTTWVTTCWA
jgi:hypothetical protein